jgi:hypothetical protein
MSRIDPLFQYPQICPPERSTLSCHAERSRSTNGPAVFPRPPQIRHPNTGCPRYDAHSAAYLGADAASPNAQTNLPTLNGAKSAPFSEPYKFAVLSAARQVVMLSEVEARMDLLFLSASTNPSSEANTSLPPHICHPERSTKCGVEWIRVFNKSPHNPHSLAS